MIEQAVYVRRKDFVVSRVFLNANFCIQDPYDQNFTSVTTVTI